MPTRNESLPWWAHARYERVPKRARDERGPGCASDQGVPGTSTCQGFKEIKYYLCRCVISSQPIWSLPWKLLHLLSKFPRVHTIRETRICFTSGKFENLSGKNTFFEKLGISKSLKCQKEVTPFQRKDPMWKYNLAVVLYQYKSI